MLIRFVYTKKDYMKYLGHLDMLRFFERAFRRLSLPLKFSEGFNPHPKMTFGGPLSVGVASEYEVMEVEITEAIDVDAFIESFNRQSPKGITITDYMIIEKSASLMHNLALMIYKVTIPLTYDKGTLDLVARYQQAEQIILRKKNKKRRWVEKNIKPFIAGIELLEEGEASLTYQFAIYSRDDGSAKPKDIVAILLSDLENFVIDDIQITRTALFFESDDGYRPLLEL